MCLCSRTLSSPSPSSGSNAFRFPRPSALVHANEGSFSFSSLFAKSAPWSFVEELDHNHTHTHTCSSLCFRRTDSDLMKYNSYIHTLKEAVLPRLRKQLLRIRMGCTVSTPSISGRRRTTMGSPPTVFGEAQQCRRYFFCGVGRTGRGISRSSFERFFLVRRLRAARQWRSATGA